MVECPMEDNMKLATTKSGVQALSFNGNCRDSRIEGALILTENTHKELAVLLKVRGLHPDSRHYKRYARAIEMQRDTKAKVRVSEA
jgi:hypothetical protein